MGQQPEITDAPVCFVRGVQFKFDASGGSGVNVQLVSNRVSQSKATAGGKTRKCHAVFQDLKRKILTGELGSDSPITEQALAQDYGCSQSTVREALMLLQENGLVDRRGYQGTFVTNPGLLEAMLLLKLRTDIETTGVTKATRLITKAQLEELREIDREFDECHAQRDIFGCAEADRALHLKLFNIAEMPVLEPMLARTSMMLQRLTLPSLRTAQTWKRPGLTPHSAVLDALEVRDIHAATNAIKAHILSSAILLAPHFYGTDVQSLREKCEERTPPLDAVSGF